MEMTTTDKIREIMALVGAEHLEEFKDTVKNEYGDPEDWDLSDELFIDQARLCAMWHSDKTVLNAREIAAVMEIEFYKDRRGIEAFHQYNNVIREFPEWNKYDTPETLLHYAKKIVNEYEQGYLEFLNENGIIPEQLKSDVVAIYIFDDRYEFLAITRAHDGKFYVRDGYDIEEGTSDTYYAPQGFSSLNDARNSVYKRYHNLTLLYEDVTKRGAMKWEKQPELINVYTPQAADKTAADSMKYNGGTFLAGVAACAQLGKKAAEYFNTHILSVFEYENENGEKRYAYAHENDERPKRAEDLTFEELQAAFEEMQSQAEKMLEAENELDEPEQTLDPKERLTGEVVITKQGSFRLTALSREQMEAAGYGLHHESEDGKYYIMGNGTRAFAVMVNQPEKQPEKTENNYEFEYQLLDRLRVDCNYFLGYGNRATKNLWAGNVEDQIAKMRELYNILPEKPEWLTAEDIDRYEKLMTTEPVPEMQSDEKKLIALFTITQCGMTKHFNMGEMTLDDVLRQFKKTALPFVEMKGEVIADGGRFAELEQSDRVSVSVTADIDNDSLKVYEINGVPEEERTDENIRIWHRPKMANFLKDRVHEPKVDAAQHSPFRGVGRIHASEHEMGM